MTFKASHNVNSKDEGKTILTPSTLTKTFVYAPLAIGLLFVLTGGLKALFGLVMIAFGLFFAANSRKVTLEGSKITFSPAFSWVKFSKPELTINKPTELTLTKVQGDFALSGNDFRFFPLNAIRVSAPLRPVNSSEVVSASDQITLAHLTSEQSAIFGQVKETVSTAVKDDAKETPASE